MKTPENLDAALSEIEQLGRWAERDLAVWEKLDREWKAAVAALTTLGVQRADVESVFDGWEDEIFADQAGVAAARLLKRYQELVPVAQVYAEAREQTTNSPAPDVKWLRARIAALNAETRSGRRGFGSVKGWPGLGDRAGRLFKLLSPHVEPERRQGLGRKPTAHVEKALALTVATINAHPDLRRWGVRMTVADLRSRLQKRNISGAGP